MEGLRLNLSDLDLAKKQNSSSPKAKAYSGSSAVLNGGLYITQMLHSGPSDCSSGKKESASRNDCYLPISSGWRAAILARQGAGIRQC